MFRYAVTIFLSAFLLFQVQPLIGKKILPWFGGTPAVWTTCMLFFQVALLAGYSYAHVLSSRISPKAQTLCHAALLVISLTFLPIFPNAERWKPTGGEMPIWQILGLLTATIGLPYFILSTTGPLLQEAYRRETGQTPYRLYALSNIGSLLALLTYPFVFEPELTLQVQVWAWSIAYIVFAAFCGWCALALSKPPHPSAAAVPESVSAHATGPASASPRARDILLWLALAACGSVMLLATTNQLCQEVCSVPFLWVVPLSLYLVTFIICFDHDWWYNRTVFLVLLAVGVLGACYALNIGTQLEMWKQLALYSFAMWTCCMVCHGELVRARPAPRFATLFYLMVSVGGAIGGILVAIVARLVLNDYWEYHIALFATIILAFFATVRSDSAAPAKSWPPLARFVGGSAIMLILAGFAIFLVRKYSPDDSDAAVKMLETTRNFYGVLHVKQEDGLDDENGGVRELVHGRIRHGLQYQDPERRQWATTYYGHPSGVGLAIDHHPRRGTGEPMRIGVVGLGAGSLAVYGRKDDTVRFYEINPEVLRISEEYFSYRKDSPANVDVVLGNARIMLDLEYADESRAKYDVLAIDAFSSDAIPMHLLTVECVQLFKKALKPDGILCVHISNRFLDLRPVVRGIAQAVGLECLLIDSEWNGSLGLNHSTWALLTQNREFLNNAVIQDATTEWSDDDPPPILWTDDYASLWQTMHWKED